MKTPLNKYCENFIHGFNKFSLSSIGFENFLLEDLNSFLKSPEIFSLNFKKKKGNGILYGISQAKYRQSFFNKLSSDLKKELIIQKIRHAKLESTLPNLNTLKGIQDIGMGSSVYYLSFLDKDLVLKQRKSIHQKFYTHLLKELNWASFNTTLFENNGIDFEVSDFVSNHTLREYFFNPKELDNTIILYLAQHAALGDFLGKGDRHFENYVLKNNNQVVPIDVSILFWPDNESWILRYAQGGMTEFSWLKRYSNKEEMIEKANFFFEVYDKTRTFLLTQISLIKDLIQEHYKEEKGIYIQYVDNVIMDPTHGYRHKQYYIEGLIESLRLESYKNTLSIMISNNKNVDDFLKMYHFSDQQRPTTFFLIHFFNRSYLLDDLQEEDHPFSDRISIRKKLLSIL